MAFPEAQLGEWTLWKGAGTGTLTKIYEIGSAFSEIGLRRVYKVGAAGVMSYSIPFRSGVVGRLQN